MGEFFLPRFTRLLPPRPAGRWTVHWIARPVVHRITRPVVHAAAGWLLILDNQCVVRMGSLASKLSPCYLTAENIVIFCGAAGVSLVRIDRDNTYTIPRNNLIRLLSLNTHITLKMKNNMKRILVAAIVVLTSITLFSCSHSVTPGEAASHHYGRCRDVR